MTVSPNRKSVQSDAPSFAVSITAAARERAQRHLQRAKDLTRLKNYNPAIQELRDAIQADPSNSEYYAWLGKVHLDQGMHGMAAVSLRQALKLNPEDALALECLQRLNAQNARQRKMPESGIGGLFNSIFGGKGRK